MQYAGYLEDGTKFDSSYDRPDPFVFNVEEGKVIKGWDVAVKTMAKGEKAKVTLAPSYAYGASGALPKIPPNATLDFEIELLKWQSNRDVFGDRAVMKTEIDAGDGWERPKENAEVTVEVIAKDSEADDAKILFEGTRVFTMGQKEVPEAWEAVLKDMKKGARVKVKCTGKYVGGPGVDYVPEGADMVVYDLKLVKWLKVEDVASDGGIMKKITKEGEGWERPNEGADVVVDLTYSVFDLETNKPKELYESKDSCKVKIGDGAVIDGLDKALTSMKKGEEVEVVIKPQYGYQTAENLLPKSGQVKLNDTIHVVAKMVSFTKAKDMWSMTFEEKAQEMRARKVKGNELFKVGRLPLALKCYERGVSFFDSSTSELSAELKKEVNQLLVQCHLNIAACQEKLKDYKKVIEHCNKALNIEPSNPKALYRRGSAYLELDDYYKAKTDLKYALEKNRNDVHIRRKLKQLIDKQAKQDALDKKLYSNLFGRLSRMEEREKAKTPGETAPISNGSVKENGGENGEKMDVDSPTNTEETISKFEEATETTQAAS